MLNQQETLFLQTLARLQWINPTQLAQAELALKTARQQSNPIPPWDMLVHWKFITADQAQQAYQQMTRQGAAQQPTVQPAVQPTVQPAVQHPVVPSALPQQATPQPVQPGTAEQTAAPSPMSDMPTQQADAPDEDESSKIAGILIGGGLAAVLALGIGGYLVYSYLNQTPDSAPLKIVKAETNYHPSSLQVLTIDTEGQVIEEAATDNTIEETPAPKKNSGAENHTGPPVRTAGGPPTRAAGGPPTRTAGSAPAPSTGGSTIRKTGEDEVKTEENSVDLETKIDQLIKGEKFGEAMKTVEDAREAVDDKEEYEGQDKAIAKLIILGRDVKKKAESRLQADQVKARELLNTNKYDDAIKVYEEARRYGVEDFNGMIEEGITQVRKQKAVRAAMMAVQSEAPAATLVGGGAGVSMDDLLPIIEAYNSIQESFGPVLSERNPIEMKKVAQEISRVLVNQPLKPFLEQLQKDIPIVESIYTRALDSLKGKIGQQISLGLPAKLLAVQGDKIDIEFAGKKREKLISNFKTTDFMRLLSITEETANAKDRLAMGVISFCDGRYPEARKYFSAVKTDYPVGIYEEMMALRDDSRAKQKVDDARRALRENNIRGLHKLLQELSKDYANTRVYKASTEFFEQCSSKITEARAKQKEEAKKILAIVEKSYKEIKGLIQDNHMAKKKIVIDMKRTDYTETSHFKLIANSNKTMDLQIVAEAQDINDKVKEVLKFLEDKNLAPQARSRLKKLKKDLQKKKKSLDMKYKRLNGQVASYASSRKRSLESKKKRLSRMVEEGKVLSENEIKEYLDVGVKPIKKKKK